MIPLPEKLKIGAHTYAIVYTSNQEELDDSLGCMDERKTTIWIDCSAPLTIQISTLFHEIFHALNTTLSSEATGHALMESLSEQFVQVLLDNALLRNFTQSTPTSL